MIVPDSHSDLLDRALPAVLTTHMPGGRLQSTVVWFWRHGAEVRLTTMRQFRKAKNLRARPRATLLVSGDDGRWVELRADVMPVPGDGMADLDAVGMRYCGVEPYLGAVVPAHLAAVETPQTFRLLPIQVVTGPVPPRAPSGTRATELPPPWRPPAPDVPLPESHLDLLDRPLLTALATTLPSGRARTQPVWCAREGDVILLSTTLERRKCRNVLADPRATVLVLDPEDSSRWIEVRGDVEIVTAGAAEVLDRMAQEYHGVPAYYSHVAPSALAGLETRATLRLHARRVGCDAIHR